jgi:hypothetical protein
MDARVVESCYRTRCLFLQDHVALEETTLREQGIINHQSFFVGGQAEQCAGPENIELCREVRTPCSPS